MAANIYIILIQVPGEKAILLMKSTLVFVSKGACAHMTFFILCSRKWSLQYLPSTAVSKSFGCFAALAL